MGLLIQYRRGSALSRLRAHSIVQFLALGLRRRLSQVRHLGLFLLDFLEVFHDVNITFIIGKFCIYRLLWFFVCRIEADVVKCLVYVVSLDSEFTLKIWLLSGILSLFKSRGVLFFIHLEISIAYGEFCLALWSLGFLSRWTIWAQLSSTLEMLVLGEVADTAVPFLHLLVELVFHLSDFGCRPCTICQGCILWVQRTFYTVIRKLPLGNNWWQNVWRQLGFISSKRLRYSIELREFFTWSRGRAKCYSCSLWVTFATLLWRWWYRIFGRLSLCIHSNSIDGRGSMFRSPERKYSWIYQKRPEVSNKAEITYF